MVVEGNEEEEAMMAVVVCNGGKGDSCNCFWWSVGRGKVGVVTGMVVCGGRNGGGAHPRRCVISTTVSMEGRAGWRPAAVVWCKVLEM